MVNPLQAPFHEFIGHQSSTKHCAAFRNENNMAAFHNEYNVAPALRKTRIYSRR